MIIKTSGQRWKNVMYLHLWRTIYGVPLQRVEDSESKIIFDRMSGFSRAETAVLNWASKTTDVIGENDAGHRIFIRSSWNGEIRYRIQRDSTFVSIAGIFSRRISVPGPADVFLRADFLETKLVFRLQPKMKNKFGHQLRQKKRRMLHGHTSRFRYDRIKNGWHCKSSARCFPFRNVYQFGICWKVLCILSRIKATRRDAAWIRFLLDIRSDSINAVGLGITINIRKRTDVPLGGGVEWSVIPLCTVIPFDAPAMQPVRIPSTDKQGTLMPIRSKSEWHGCLVRQSSKKIIVHAFVPNILCKIIDQQRLKLVSRMFSICGLKSGCGMDQRGYRPFGIWKSLILFSILSQWQRRTSSNVISDWLTVSAGSYSVMCFLNERICRELINFPSDDKTGVGIRSIYTVTATCSGRTLASVLVSQFLPSLTHKPTGVPFMAVRSFEILLIELTQYRPSQTFGILLNNTTVTKICKKLIAAVVRFQSIPWCQNPESEITL